MVLNSVQAIYDTSVVPLELRAAVVESYMRSIRQIYIMVRRHRRSLALISQGVPLSILMILTAFVVR